MYLNRDSDTDGDGDMSDHDLTPCNASPSLPYSWPHPGPEMGHCGGGGRVLEQEEVEDMWKAQVAAVMQNSTNEALMESFTAFGKLFNVSHLAKTQRYENVYSNESFPTFRSSV